MTFRLALPVLSVALLALIGVDAMGQERVEVPFEKYELPNGLDVILHEDHSTPIVAVNVWYHVGSSREKKGRSGFAHLFEHMMFQGSEHVGDDEHFRLIQEAGGTLNGSTNPDRTNYWEVLPSNYLEMALWLEADRMGFLLPAMTKQKFENQRDVVKNERRQNYENRPYGLARKVIYENLYPENHPYHWLTIGTQEDLSAASLEDVKEFFRRYYGPNNASLVIGGDFDREQVKQWVQKYFGDLPRGPEVARPIYWLPELDEEKRLMMEDRVRLPRLYLVWHTPPLFAKGDAELDLLADVLAGGKSSRLYKSLVYEKQIAQSVMAYQSSREMAGTFWIVATAKPGYNLAELEREIDLELERIRTEPVTEREIERARNGIEANTIYRLQRLGGFGGKTDQLNAYNTYMLDPGYFDEDLARYFEATPESIRRTAARYLHERRLVLSVVPKGKPELQATK
jgi:zinc protease